MSRSHSESLVTIAGLPTDNLYKFMALAGLLIAISIQAMTIGLFERDRERLDGVTLELAGIQSDIRALEEDAGASGLTPDTAGLRRAHDIQRANAIVGAKLEVSRRLTSRLKGVVLYGSIATALALVLSFLGFVLWYERLQRYQDRITKTQAGL